MTNEEAIKKLKSFCHNCNKFPQCVNTDRECFEALDMAIRALKNEPTDGDLISRQAVLDIFGDIHPLDYNARAYVTQIKELPSAEKILGGDLDGGDRKHN